jgi:hypothetical protein
VARMFKLQDHDRQIDPEEIHNVLRNHRRRRTLQCLKERLEPIGLRELSEQIAEWETSTSPPPRDARQSVYNSLHQTHLPKLDETGIVDYDKSRKVVELGEHARVVDMYTDVFTGFGITWTTYYRTLGVIGLLTVVLTAADFSVFSGVEPLVFATVFLAVFGLSTVYQMWMRRWFYLRMMVSET